MLCFFWPWGMWNLSSLIRDQTHMLWIRRWGLNHWTILEVSRRAVLSLQQNWENGTEISYIPLPLHKHGCLSYLHPPPEVVHLLRLINLHPYLVIIQSSDFTLGVTVDGVHSVALDRCILNDIQPSLWYQAECIHCPKNPLRSAYSSLSFPTHGDRWFFFFFLPSP